MRGKILTLVLTLLGLSTVGQASSGRYLELDEFLRGVFGSAQPASTAIVIDSQLRGEIEEILGHRFARLRVRYWETDGTTAWIFDEIGKTEPITIGVSISDNRVGTVRILEFRESRGWEVRYPFFTDQFDGAELRDDRHLDRTVDGITGATLSVTAVQKVVRVALLINNRVRDGAARRRSNTRS